MRLLRDTCFSRRAAWVSLFVIFAVGASLAILTGCSDDPSKPRVPVTPPAQLPDDFPASGMEGDSLSPPQGGEPGEPGEPPDPREAGRMWVRYRAFNDPAQSDVGLWILHGGRAAAMSLAEGPPAHHAWITPDTMRIVAGWFRSAGFRELPQESYFTGSDPGRICEIFLADSAGVARRVIGELAAMPDPVRRLVFNLDGLATHILLSWPDGPPPPPHDSTWVPPDDSTWVPPPPPPIRMPRAELSAEPVSAPEGTPRHLRLELNNDTRDSVILVFRTSQLYDIELWDPMMGPPPGDDSTWVPPPEDSTWVPPNPPPGGGGDGDSTWVPPHGDSTWVPPGDSTWAPPGMPPGGGPDCPGHGHAGYWRPLRGDGTDPTGPPDSTWTPPDSGGVPGDTVWVPPPDSTGTMPERLVWNWASGRAFERVETVVVVPPGGVLVYEETWDGYSNEGGTVRPGVYLVRASFLSELPVMMGMSRLEVTAR